MVKRFSWKITNFELWHCCCKWATCCRHNHKTVLKLAFRFYTVNKTVLYPHIHFFFYLFGYVVRVRIIFFFLSFLYRASFQHMERKPTDVTILFVYCWISTCFGPTGPSSRKFVLLFTQQLVQYLPALDACSAYRARVQKGQILNQWLCEQQYELSWRWACGPETCRDPAIYE